LLFGARCAHAHDLNILPLHAKSPRQLPGKTRRFHFTLTDIGDGSAHPAYQVMVRVQIRVQPQGTMMQAYFADHSRIDKRLDVFVNGSEGDRWYEFPNRIVYSFRCRVILGGEKRLVDHLPLVSGGESMALAAFTEHRHELLLRMRHSFIKR
jgi:hypothetical protein